METGKPLDNLSKQVSCIRQLEIQASFQKLPISLFKLLFLSHKDTLRRRPWFRETSHWSGLLKCMNNRPMFSSRNDANLAMY